MAVAGFAEDELEIIVRGGVLRVVEPAATVRMLTPSFCIAALPPLER